MCIADLLTKNVSGTGAITLYLLYDIKRMPLISMDDLEEEEMGTETEDDLNIGQDDDQNESSQSSSSSHLKS